MKLVKYRFWDVRERFNGMLLSVSKRHRVKFNFYQVGKRPVKGSGFLKSLELGFETKRDDRVQQRLIVIVFSHLRLQGLCSQNKLYITEGTMALKNIRFKVESLGQYHSLIMNDTVLNNFFANHFETKTEKQTQRSLTKFDIAVS
jgi:hypothetical protein